jgi:hypothetical protein
MDVSTVAYIMPLLAFLLVFVVSYALLSKTKILGGNNFLHLFMSFVLAIVFIVSPNAQKFAMISTPWIAVLIVAIFFIMLMLVFVRGKIDDIVQSPTVAIILVGILLLIFIISAINVFGPVISPYLPGSSEAGMTVQETATKHFFTSPAVIGAVILLIVAAIASWIIAK